MTSGRTPDPRPDDAPPLTVPERFNGPAGSANGGYVCGLVAARLAGRPAVRVTLRQPPPLDTPLAVTAAGAGLQVRFGGVVIAEAAPAALDLEPVEPVSWGAAREAGRAYGGWARHPFPRCFTCGTQREPPDALGLRPGPVGGHADTTASAWAPHAELDDGTGAVPAEVVWAALDCPGGWSLDLTGRTAVLGQLTAAVDERPLVGDRCVVMGRLLGREGRKSFTATTLYDGDGRVLARAHGVWITVDATVADAEAR